jgi:hypothetical protein
MSWGFEDDQYPAISVDTRKTKGQDYSALRGFFRQYALIYVVTDERDVVRLRTNCRGEDVYLYRLDAPTVNSAQQRTEETRDGAQGELSQHRK